MTRVFLTALLVVIAVGSGAAQVERAFGIYAATYVSDIGLHQVTSPNGQNFFIRSAPDIDERDITSATYGVHDLLPGIKLAFTKEGAQRFSDLTRKNLRKPLVFMVHDKVVMVPFVESPSAESYVWITGAFSEQEVRALLAAISSTLPKRGR